MENTLTFLIQVIPIASFLVIRLILFLHRLIQYRRALIPNEVFKHVHLMVCSFLEIVLHAFAQNNDLVRIFRSIFFALVDKLRAKS